MSRDQMQFLEKAKQRLESATPNDNRLSELERIVIEMESNLQDNAGNNALYERAKEIAKKMRSGERSSVEGKAMSRLLNKAMDIKTGKTAKKAKKSRS